MAPKAKKPKDDLLLTNFEWNAENLGSASSPSRDLEAEDAWCLERSHRLGADFVEKNAVLEEVSVVDRVSVSSVVEAIEALNTGTLSCSQDACIVYSASNRCHFLLWREGCQNLSTLMARLGVSYKSAIARPQEKAASSRRALTPTGSKGLEQHDSIMRTSSLKNLKAKEAVEQGLVSSPTLQPKPCRAPAAPPSFAAPSRQFSPTPPDRPSSPLSRSSHSQQFAPSRFQQPRSPTTAESRIYTSDALRSQAASTLSPRELCQVSSWSSSAFQSRAGSIRVSDGQLSPASINLRSTVSSPMVGHVGPKRPASPLRTSIQRGHAEIRNRSVDAMDFQGQSGLQFRFRGLLGPTRRSIGSLHDASARVLTPPRTSALSSSKSACVLHDARSPRSLTPPRTSALSSSKSACVLSDTRNPCSQAKMLRAQQNSPDSSVPSQTVVSKFAQRDTASKPKVMERSGKCFPAGVSLPQGVILPLRGESRCDVESVYAEVNASYPVALLLNQVVDEWIRIPSPALASLSWKPATLKCHLSAMLKKQKQSDTRTQSGEDRAFAEILCDEQVWNSFERAVHYSCRECTLRNDLAGKIISTVWKAISRDTGEDEERERTHTAITVDGCSREANWAALDLNPRGPWGFPMPYPVASDIAKLQDGMYKTGPQGDVYAGIPDGAGQEKAKMQERRSKMIDPQADAYEESKLEKSGSSSTMTTDPATPPQEKCKLRPAIGLAQSLIRQALHTESAASLHTGSTTSLANMCRQIVEAGHRPRSRSRSSQESSRPSSYGPNQDHVVQNGGFGFPVGASTCRSRGHSPVESQPQSTLQPRQAEHHGASLYAELCDKLQDHQDIPDLGMAYVEETPSFRNPLHEVRQQEHTDADLERKHMARTPGSSKITAPHGFSFDMQPEAPAAQLSNSQSDSKLLGIGNGHTASAVSRVEFEGKELRARSQLVPPFPFQIQIPEDPFQADFAHRSTNSGSPRSPDEERIAGSSMSPRQMEQKDHLSGRHSARSQRSSPRSSPRKTDEHEGGSSTIAQPPSSMIAQPPASPRPATNQSLATVLRVHKFPESSHSETSPSHSIPIGARVEAYYETKWYIGTVLALPESDKSGRYMVQCDVDEAGVFTFTSDVKLVSKAKASPRAEASVGRDVIAVAENSKHTPRRNSPQGMRTRGAQVSARGKRASDTSHQFSGQVAAKQDRGVVSKRPHSAAATRSRTPPKALTKLTSGMNMAG